MLNVKKLLFLGCSSLYLKFAPQTKKEEYILSGQLEATNETYAIAKIAGIKMCEAYNSQHDTNFISIIPTNLYGPNDHFDLETSYVLPALIRKFIEAIEEGIDEAVAWGIEKPTRGFLYAEDAAEGILLAAERYNKSDPVNLGSDLEISIKDLAELIDRLTGFKGKINWDRSKPDGQPRRKLDTNRAEREFGFKAELDFEEGLKRTIE